MTQPILYFRPTPGGILEFTPPSPAKLAAIAQIALTLDDTGADGLVYVLAQHYNDRLGAWCSLADVAGAWSVVGSLAASGALTSVAFNAGPGERMLIGLGFQSTDGTKPAPAFLTAEVTWSSDVTAPAAPTISAITSVAPTGGQVGYRVDFGALPTGARHFVVEGQLNGGAWLPFSKKATWTAGTSYMEFRGALDAVEAAGERNERHLSSTGFTLGDVVSVRVAAEDSSGNRSAFTVSDAVTIAGATYIAVPASTIRLSLRSSRLTLRLR